MAQEFDINTDVGMKQFTTLANKLLLSVGYFLHEYSTIFFWRDDMNESYENYQCVVNGYYTRWYNEHGQLHREDGPADICTKPRFRYNRWYRNGKLHREDGPAAIGAYFIGWYIHGIELSEDEFNEVTRSKEHINWFLLNNL